MFQRRSATAVATFLAGILAGVVLPVAAAQFGMAYPDVRSQDYFHDAVWHLSRFGIIRGYQNGRFGPNDLVTRGQAAVMLQRYDQTMVQPLREQIDELRRKAGLGFCGDSKRQTGEQCDDGNVTDGDGCSDECLAEIASSGGSAFLCEGRYRVGERYRAADGCNTCTCTENGSLCTLMACGSCQPITCADGRQYPSCSADGYPINYFADPCGTGGASSRSSSSRAAQCGNGICDGNESATAQTSRVYCPQDCRSGSACANEKQAFTDTANANRACSVDSDCTLFVASCPYLTCGESVRKDAISRLSNAADAYFICQQQTGQATACAGCTQQRAVCEQGRCVGR